MDVSLPWDILKFASQRMHYLSNKQLPSWFFFIRWAFGCVVNFNWTIKLDCSLFLKAVISFLAADVDECATGNHRCSSNALCVNHDGSYGCQCRPGYTGDGFSCTGKLPSWINAQWTDQSELFCYCRCIPLVVSLLFFFLKDLSKGLIIQFVTMFDHFLFFFVTEDIDECKAGTIMCHVNAICINSAGSAMCRCQTGYVGDGQTCRGAIIYMGSCWDIVLCER